MDAILATGGCAEDCGYCPQSAHFDTGLAAGRLMPLAERDRALLKRLGLRTRPGEGAR